MEDVPNGDVKLRPEYKDSSMEARGSFQLDPADAADAAATAAAAAEGP